MDLHALGEGVAQAAVAGGADADGRLDGAQPDAGHGGPLQALAVDGHHVLQEGLLGGQHVEVLDPVHAVGREGQAVVLGPFVASVEEVLLAGETHLHVVLHPGIAGHEVAALLVLPGGRQFEGVDSPLVGPVQGLAVGTRQARVRPGQQQLRYDAHGAGPLGLGVREEVVAGERRLVQEVEGLFLGVQVVHQPDDVEGRGAHFIADLPVIAVPPHRRAEEIHLRAQVAVLQQGPVAHAQGHEGRHVEPALDGLEAHAVLVEVPVQHGPGLMDAPVDEALVVALLPFDEQQEAHVLHAEPLVVVDHEMIGAGQEVADAVAADARDDAASLLALLGGHPAVQVVVVEEGPQLARGERIAVGGHGLFEGPQAVAVRLGIEVVELPLQAGDLRRQVPGLLTTEGVVLGHQGVEGRLAGLCAFPHDAEGRRGLVAQGHLGAQTGDLLGGGQDAGVDAGFRHRRHGALVEARGAVVHRDLGRRGPDAAAQDVLGGHHDARLPARVLVVGPIGGVGAPAGDGEHGEEGGGQAEAATVHVRIQRTWYDTVRRMLKAAGSGFVKTIGGSVRHGRAPSRPRPRRRPPGWRPGAGGGPGGPPPQNSGGTGTGPGAR